MLSDNSLYIASKVAKRLAERGIKLDARVGSPIALLMSSSTYVGEGAARATDFINVVKADISNYGKVEGGDCIHDEKMDWARDLITKGVSRDLEIAKNIIKPVIDQTLSDVEKDLEEACSGKLHGYEIVQDQVPQLFLDQKMENLFERYKNIPIKPMRTLLVFPTLTLVEIQDRLKTGDDEVNLLLTESLTENRLNGLVETYEWYFGERGISEIDFGKSYDGDPLVPVILYFLTLGLEANMPSGVNASIGVVTNYLKNLRGMLGAAVYRNMRQIERAIEDKQLIQTVTGVAGERVISVNKIVYDKFLDEGGSAEAILGTVVGNGSFVYGAMLATNSKLEKAWAAHLDTIAASNDMNKLSLIILAIRKSVSGQIAAMEILPTDAGTKGDMQQRLAAATRNFYLTDLDNLPRSVRRLVFDVMFPAQANARFIIETMDKQECEEGEVGKLAATATTALVGEWLVKNLDVLKA